VSGSWVPEADGSGFGIENLPYGVLRAPGGPGRPAVRIGGHALDLAVLAGEGLLDVPTGTFDAPTLNRFLALGRSAWTTTRRRLVELLAAGSPDVERVAGALRPLERLEPLLPVAVGDYVDFYSSIEHATNLGRMLRPNAEPLMPNWRHLPVGYHGRAGTVVVSGTPVRRPLGQRAAAEGEERPGFGPERRLDIEVELGFVTGPGPPLGTPIAAHQAAEVIFGFVLVNDWSAREIQRWEYQPLGPFLGKSFATSISPWIVPLEALAGARVAGPPQDPPPLPYLQVDEPWTLDVALETALLPAGSDAATTISRTNARGLYWSPAQQIAHATVNGAAVAAGDLFASGTISGSEPGSYGSLIELTWNGRDPIPLAGGVERTFLEDGDTVVIRGRSGRVSFGEVRGRIEPARGD
jgi:fumarylacetoacetase